MKCVIFWTKVMSFKHVIKVVRDLDSHWVGDGFPVNTLLSYHRDGPQISPFLLLDYAGPAQFSPSNQQRGVGVHPHRGFETVTIVYQGEVEHQDNAGHAGKIGPGDVQWMTAARGIVHEERHSLDFSKKGGTLEMVQLWVNLPAKDKMSPPHYQEILSHHIPVISLDEQGSVLRVIAGNYGGIQGVAQTFTPMNIWDLKLKADIRIDLKHLPQGFNTMLLVLKGSILVNNTHEINAKELAFFSQEQEAIALHVKSDAVILVLNGQPIDEPIVGHGPFVMNTKQEIMDAFKDYR